MEEDILNSLYQLSCFVGHPVSKVYDIVLNKYRTLKIRICGKTQFLSELTSAGKNLQNKSV